MVLALALMGCSATDADIAAKGAGGTGTGGTGTAGMGTAGNQACANGSCKSGCQLAQDEPSNVGCEFFSVQLDLSDGVSQPGGGPWGVVLANAGQAAASVVIESNDAPLGA